MPEYCVRWLEEHECIVKAENEEDAREQAFNENVKDSVIDKPFDIRVEKEE